LRQVDHDLVRTKSPESFAASGAANHGHDMCTGAMCELDGEATDTACGPRDEDTSSNDGAEGPQRTERRDTCHWNGACRTEIDRVGDEA
jgi:hypothetical protein